jgi:2-polyprenyl-6-methoxyphenol hydroxylase-like FAD-dependent oxidoreductase
MPCGRVAGLDGVEMACAGGRWIGWTGALLPAELGAAPPELRPGIDLLWLLALVLMPVVSSEILSCYVAHRADLLAVLERAVPRERLGLDHRCVEVGQDQDEDEVVLTFANRAGRTIQVRADAAIGADRIHSVLRPSIAGQVEARFSGLCAFRCLVPAERAPAMARRPVQTLWLGPGHHFVHYPISNGVLINVVALAPAGSWRAESWTADGEVADLRPSSRAGTRASTS